MTWLMSYCLDPDAQQLPPYLVEVVCGRCQDHPPDDTITVHTIAGPRPLRLCAPCVEITAAEVV